MQPRAWGRAISVAIIISLMVGCGSRTASKPLPLSKVEQAYRAAGFKPIANIAAKTPRSWLGDFYLGDPEPSTHVTVFRTESDAKHAPIPAVWRTIRERNVVVTFFHVSPQMQARIERILRRVAS